MRRNSLFKALLSPGLGNIHVGNIAISVVYSDVSDILYTRGWVSLPGQPEGARSGESRNLLQLNMHYTVYLWDCTPLNWKLMKLLKTYENVSKMAYRISAFTQHLPIPHNPKKEGQGFRYDSRIYLDSVWRGVKSKLCSVSNPIWRELHHGCFEVDSLCCFHIRDFRCDHFRGICSQHCHR